MCIYILQLYMTYACSLLYDLYSLRRLMFREVCYPVFSVLARRIRYLCYYTLFYHWLDTLSTKRMLHHPSFIFFHYPSFHHPLPSPFPWSTIHHSSWFPHEICIIHPSFSSHPSSINHNYILSPGCSPPKYPKLKWVWPRAWSIYS